MEICIVSIYPTSDFSVMYVTMNLIHTTQDNIRYHFKPYTV